MDVNELITPLRRWWWLILIATVVATGVSYYASLQQPPVYQSRATLMIGRTIDNPNPTSNQFNLEEQLAAGYANIANREPLREATKVALGMDWLPEYSVTALPNTQLIEIAVLDTDPQRAQSVANEIANQLILRSPTGENQEDIERQAFINEQLDTLQNQITDTQTEIADLSFSLGDLDSAREISDTQNQIASLQNKLTSLRSNYANLLTNTQKGAINTLTIIEQPHLPIRPVGSQQFISVGLAGAVGFSLAAAAAYLLEYLDKTIKTEDELKKLISAPIIGHIPKIKKNENKWYYVNEQPRSPVADAFRGLRTNIDLIEGNIKTILVTGSIVSEGKSTVAVNLAHISAQSNKKVVLLDGDLRKSVLNENLEIANDRGLSNILQNGSSINDELTTLERGLIVLPAGPPPPNPTELLTSQKMDQVLEELSGMAELIIIDSPPFIVADPSILSTKVDGILIVVRLGHTRRDTLRIMIEQINRTGTTILGVVLNNVTGNSSYYYHYYGNYYSPEDSNKEQNLALEEGDAEEPDTLLPIP